MVEAGESTDAPTQAPDSVSDTFTPHSAVTGHSRVAYSQDTRR